MSENEAKISRFVHSFQQLEKGLGKLEIPRQHSFSFPSNSSENVSKRDVFKDDHSTGSASPHKHKERQKKHSPQNSPHSNPFDNNKPFAQLAFEA